MEANDFCSSSHIANVNQYCLTCNIFLCEDCTLVGHIDHALELIESACLQKYSAIKQIHSMIKTTIKQSNIGIQFKPDEALSIISNKVSNAFSKVQEKLEEEKTKFFNNIIESPEFKKELNSLGVNNNQNNEKEKIQGDENNAAQNIPINEIDLKLASLETDSWKKLNEIEQLFNQKKFIVLYKVNCNEQLDKLKKELIEVKKLQKNPLKGINEYTENLQIKVNLNKLDLSKVIKIQSLFDYKNKPPYFFDMEKNILYSYNLTEKFPIKYEFKEKFQVVPFHSQTFMLTSKKIYCAGGDDEFYRKETLLLDLKKMEIKKLANLSEERRNHLILGIRMTKLIFVVGGANAKKEIESVEEYSIVKNEWRFIKPLNSSRQLSGGCSFNSRILYIFGGIVKGNHVNSIERIDLNDNNGWEVVKLVESDQWSPRKLSGCLQISADEIIIIGGKEKLCTRQCYKYSHSLRKITPISQLPFGDYFSDYSLSLFGNYVVGIGFDTNHIYTYDRTIDKWTCIKAENYLPEDLASM